MLPGGEGLQCLGAFLKKGASPELRVAETLSLWRPAQAWKRDDAHVIPCVLSLCSPSSTPPMTGRRWWLGRRVRQSRRLAHCHISKPSSRPCLVACRYPRALTSSSPQLTVWSGAGPLGEGPWQPGHALAVLSRHLGGQAPRGKEEVETGRGNEKRLKPRVKWGTEGIE